GLRFIIHRSSFTIAPVPLTPTPLPRSTGGEGLSLRLRSSAPGSLARPESRGPPGRLSGFPVLSGPERGCVPVARDREMTRGREVRPDLFPASSTEGIVMIDNKKIPRELCESDLERVAGGKEM